MSISRFTKSFNFAVPNVVALCVCGMMFTPKQLSSTSFTVSETPLIEMAMRIARLYTQAGDLEMAVDLLEKSYDERFVSMFSLNVDPHWDPLKDSERFQVLLKKMDFPD